MAKTNRPPEIPRLDTDAEYVEARDNRLRIQAERAEAETELREAITARESLSERRGERVAAIVANESVNGAGAPDREHVTKLRQRVRDLAAAEDIARKNEAGAASHASARLVEDVREHRVEQMRRLSAALVELGAVATDVARFQEELSDAGLSWTSYLPAVAVGWMRQDVPDSRLNLLVDEIARDYPEAEPGRPLLEEALEARHRAHMEEEERKRKEGIGIAAGPDGIHDRPRGRRVRT